MDPVRLPHLHKGFWLYQSSRALLLAVYLYRIGVSREKLSAIIERHVSHVVERLRRVREKAWIVERLEMLGYQPKRAGSSSVARSLQFPIIAEYERKMGLTGLVGVLTRIMDILRGALGIRNVEELAYLPPVLSLPEKLLTLRAIASSKFFALPEMLKALVYTTLGFDIHAVVAGERDTVNREFRFRFCHLYNIHMAGGSRREPRITGLGLYTLTAIREGIEPLTAYTRYAVKTRRLQRMIILDIMAFDAFTNDKLERLLKYEAAALDTLGVEYDDALEEARRMVTLTPSDKPGVYFVAPLEHVDDVLEKIYL